MFTVSTSFSLDRRRIERILRLPGGLVYRNMERRVRRAEVEAIRRAPGSMGTTIRAQIQRYVQAGVSKFVLRPLAHDFGDLIAQTQRLIESVIPAVET